MDMDRGASGGAPRLRSLDLESQQDFIRGFRRFVYGDLDPAAKRHGARLLDRAGLGDGPDVPIEAVRAVLHADPLVATRNRCWATSQIAMRREMLSHLRDHAEQYLDELNPGDACSNDGGLHLDPDLNIPDYARHEIHLQPGGYVGERFAGFLYHHGTNSFYDSLGGNESDQIHQGLAARAAVPSDGRVERIVDLGCGIGQLAMALKGRFPAAQVTGIDVGAPMLRYGHARAVGQDRPVRFVQALAEETGLDDASVDVVSAYLLFHEVPARIARQIVAEAFRILRPGGVFNVFDFQTGQPRDAYVRYASWVDHRYNNEVWSQEFLATDFRGVLRATGFTLDADDGVRGMTRYAARKSPA
jgi:ubiquinone/menaquinone biosynthesis C-methylase UbiE